MSISSRVLSRLSLAILLVVLAFAAFVRYQTIRQDALAVGHRLGQIEGVDNTGQRVTVADKACHVIRFGSSGCPACKADVNAWHTLETAMLDKGCNVTLVAPDAKQLDEDQPRAGVYRMREVNASFIAASRFRYLPTTVIADSSWRVLWSHTGILESSDLDLAIRQEPEPLVAALLRPQERHLQPASRASLASDAKAVPASLDVTKADLPVAGSPTYGPAAAPVVITEFADFQCPFCARAAAPLQQLLAKYPSEVKLVFKQFPLGIHQFARPAADLSIEAAARGRFWQVYEGLYKASPRLSEEVFQQTAHTADLNWQHMSNTPESPEALTRIHVDVSLGKSVGVEGTPTLFVNGRKYIGPVDLDNLERIVKQELAKTKPGMRAGS